MSGVSRQQLPAVAPPAVSPLNGAVVTPARSGGQFSLRAELTIPNAVTSACIVTGLAVILEATRTGVPLPAGRLRLVVVLIIFAAVLDSIDGPLARRRAARRAQVPSGFGAELDSLADVVAFGAAPAVAVYFAQLHSLPGVGLAASAAFCVGAAWRLARFPFCKTRLSFVGCPVPLAAVITALLALAGSAVLTAVATVALSALMVSTMPFPTWAGAFRAVGKPGRALSSKKEAGA